MGKCHHILGVTDLSNLPSDLTGHKIQTSSEKSIDLMLSLVVYCLEEPA